MIPSTPLHFPIPMIGKRVILRKGTLWKRSEQSGIIESACSYDDTLSFRSDQGGLYSIKKDYIKCMPTRTHSTGIKNKDYAALVEKIGGRNAASNALGVDATTIWRRCSGPVVITTEMMYALKYAIDHKDDSTKMVL